MAMPPQLERGLWARRQSRHREQRPLVEQMQRIDIADLCRYRVFPSQNNWHERWSLELPFRYPFLKNLIISRQAIEANHLSGYTQSIRLRWCCTGFGGNSRPRPLFICNCGRRPVTKLYFNYGRLACRRCCKATYASRICSKRLRPIMQVQRMQAFLRLKSYMWQSTRQRLKTRIAAAPKQVPNSKRLTHHAIQLPQSNYGTRGAMHWR